MTFQNSLVSVVVPVYNGERFIGRTLASALAQTYDPIEVVVVDDGSTDRTAILVEAAAARDKRIRHFRIQNSGVAVARNLGISQAKGNLIAPLDADDLWHPEKVARQVGVMQASPAAVGVVYCWSIHIDENDFVIRNSISSCSRAQGRIIAELAENNILGNASSPLIRRSCIDAVGGYDTTLSPPGALDWKLYFALSEVCEFAVVPEYLVGYRQFTGNMSSNITAMARSLELVTCWIFEKRPDISEKVRRRSIYNTNVYLARKALENNQLFAALRYHTTAYKLQPTRLFERSSVEFGARVLARMARLRRPTREHYDARIPFQDFLG